MWSNHVCRPGAGAIFPEVRSSCRLRDHYHRWDDQSAEFRPPSSFVWPLRKENDCCVCRSCYWDQLPAFLAAVDWKMGYRMEGLPDTEWEEAGLQLRLVRGERWIVSTKQKGLIRIAPSESKTGLRSTWRQCSYCDHNWTPDPCQWPWNFGITEWVTLILALLLINMPHLYSWGIHFTSEM